MKFELSPEETTTSILEMLIACCAQQQAVLKALKARVTLDSKDAALEMVLNALELTGPDSQGLKTLQSYTVDMLIKTLASLSACTDLVTIALSTSDEHAERITNYVNECREKSISRIMEDLYTRRGTVDLNQIMTPAEGSNP